MPTKALLSKSSRKKSGLNLHRSKRGWKDVQSKSKRGRLIKLALCVLALVLGLLIVSWTIRLTQSLFSPWKITPGLQRTYIWNGEFNLNLLLRSDHVSLLSYNPKEQKILLIDIPDETFLEVPNGFGFWQLRAVFDLGESQKQGGDRLLKEALSSFLATPVDGFLDLSAYNRKQTPAQILEIIRANPVSGLNLLSSLKTDLTVLELIRLKFSLAGVRFDKVKQLNLENYLDKDKLPDGTEILTGDPVKIDSALIETADPTIIAEHKSIAIFNATDKPLLAQKAARLITNLGGNVIITNNADARLKKTITKGGKSATLKRLRQIFVSDDKISTAEAITSRSEINLFVGEDYAD